MKHLSILLNIITLLLSSNVIIIAQAIPKSADERVLLDAETRALFEQLKPDEKKSLVSLNKIYVALDRVTTDFITQSPSGLKSIIEAIEVRLNNADIKTVKYEEFRKTMGNIGYPFLKIKIDVKPDPKVKNSYSGLVKVALTQRVIMQRFTNTSNTSNNPVVSTSVYYPASAVYLLKLGTHKNL